MKDILILDCTLRDGGYINDWNWKNDIAKDIIKTLSKANVDIVEVGFLRNVDEFDPNITVANRIEELNTFLPSKKTSKNVLYSAMAMCSNYDISKLSDYSGEGISLIRITAHDYDINEGLEFAKKVQNKGYKVSINPINIMGYSDEQLISIIKKVNEIVPFQFSIVDTFGSMKRRDLDRIVSIVDHNLDKTIRLGLHLHENMSLSFSLAQNFFDKHIDRPISIDGSLYGMGRTPGNLPIELIADYLNEYSDMAYDIDYMMDSILDYIMPLRGVSNWGYSPSYFLSAKYNLHRNYAEFYLAKGDLTFRDINHILAQFDKDRNTVFDEKYAEQCYMDYKNALIDDKNAFSELKKKLGDKEILLLAPGKTIVDNMAEVKEFIAIKKPVVISINFEPNEYVIDYSFFSNSKRYEKYRDTAAKKIVTSNIKVENCAYAINHNRIGSAFEMGYNSYVLLIKLLREIGISHVAVAGADGFKPGNDNYFTGMYNIDNDKRTGNFNKAIKKAIGSIGMDVEYITPSLYKD